jgi:hypothetical protein
MSYETDQLINQARTVFSQVDNRTQSLEARLWQAEQKVEELIKFMLRAEPYIKAMELIDPPAKQTP